MLRLSILILLVAALSAPSALAQDGHVPGRVIVTFAPGADAGMRAATHQRVGGTVIDRLAAIDADVVAVGSGNESRAVQRYRRQDGVRAAELDVLVRALHDDLTAAPTNDPYVLKEWALQNDHLTLQPPDSLPQHDADIDAVGAWSAGETGSGVRIAVLDSGIDADHEEFPRPTKVVAERNFSSSKSLDDKYGHGTHVAGTAGAPGNNGIGVAGVAYDAALLNVKVLSDNGMGSCSAVANGILWASDPAQGAADVINMSLGGGACTAEENAVNTAWSRGAVLVAAAGNSNSSSPSCPACYANVIAVGATDNADRKASFSNYGDWIDVSAPGVQVFSTFPNHRNRIGKRNYDYGSGTSMSTPHVSGVAALVFGLPLEPELDNIAVRDRIETNADDIPETDGYWAAGRLNACNAVVPGSCALSRE